ncbi:MAG: hypothetical protein QW416_07955 [Candidatus Nitrosocaldaceae archaeon]
MVETEIWTKLLDYGLAGIFIYIILKQIMTKLTDIEECLKELRDELRR